MPIEIDRIDHVVLTVKDLKKTIAFYETVLGFRSESFGEGRTALKFGKQKFNLHEAGKEFEPRARQALPGTIDLCLIANTKLSDVMAHLREHEIQIEKGPIQRTGATGPIESVYFRDPASNLIEVSNY
jgi:catechol 2,3-dioxygenase-like lactoylglutathione lyase family enzyme